MLLHASNLALSPLANAGGCNNSLGLGSMLPIPDNLMTPPNQNYPLPSNAVSGSGIPKNMIVGPSCVSGCPAILAQTRMTSFTECP